MCGLLDLLHSTDLHIKSGYVLEENMCNAVEKSLHHSGTFSYYVL